MSRSHTHLVVLAKEAIQNVSGDTSVSPGTTRSSLEEIIEHAEEYLQAVVDTSEDEDDVEAGR